MADRRRVRSIRITAVLGAVLFAVVMVCSPCAANTAQARNRVLKLSAARSLAIQESLAYESAEDAVSAKEAAYNSAVKSLALKQKNMSTFRWSPLLSFKFPETPDLAQASEFQFKPVQLRYDIIVAQHKLQDKVFDINERLNTIYVEIVVLQRTISFNERRLHSYELGLKRNEARLRTGDATQADVDSIKRKKESLETKIASDKRSLEAKLKKMSDMIGLDVTTGYDFENPFVEADIPRSQLPSIIKYAEDRDETYFEACINETTARLELSTNYSLMNGKLGRDMGMISTYVNQALSGNIGSKAAFKRAFKSAYKDFIKKIDSYWEGKKRILFIKIPRLWFKGSLDGTRYIEDDPYVLFNNVLDYNDALNEKLQAQKDLDQNVTDTYENYISIRNSYKQLLKDVATAEKQLKEDEIKNRLGEVSFEEYDSEMASYEELQNSLLDTMQLYSTTLYSFDRLTCGGVSAFLSGTDADLHTAVVGESFAEKKKAEGAQYYLKPIIQDMEFEVSIYIPEDFEVEITDYELWVNNTMIGTRTAKNKKIRHLGLTVDKVDKAFIRLYNGDQFVDDCTIDPDTESGPLAVTSGFEIKKTEADELGTYELSAADAAGLIKISIKPDDEKVKKWLIKDSAGTPVGNTEPIAVDKQLTYLSLFSDSLREVTIELYGDDGTLINTGRFDETESKIRKVTQE